MRETAEPMDAETLEALNASIEKWERNAVVALPSEARVYGHDCPLCDVFFEINETCAGCPVAVSTGQEQCEGSPWDAARSARNAWFADRTDENAETFRAAARAEVAFLKSLLPALSRSKSED